jgi:hypothetical protein
MPPSAAAVPHAFGGALALAWWTQRARGTIDIDVNIFVDPSKAADVLAVPRGIRWAEEDLDALAADGQGRLWRGTTPVDVFMNTSKFHAQATVRSRREPLAGGYVPSLPCSDLAAFKAFFNRTQDWADLEQMAEGGRHPVAIHSSAGSRPCRNHGSAVVADTTTPKSALRRP